MALYCVACAAQQPEDNPPLTKGAMCVRCKTCNTFTTLAPPGQVRPWDLDITPADQRFLRGLKISPK